MARWDNTRMRKIIHGHEYFLEEVQAIAGARDYYAAQVQEMVGELLAKKAALRLKDVPVEEINRGQRGIPIKALKDAGYESVADVATLTYKQLDDIPGIGDQSAYAIKARLSGMMDAAKTNVKITFSTDDRTKDMENLVHALCVHRETGDVEAQAQDFLAANSQSVNALMKDANHVYGFFQWLFLNRDKKDKALSALYTLEDMDKGDYGNEARKMIAEYRGIVNLSNDDTWTDFERDPIGYVTLLERLVPGLIGDDEPEGDFAPDLFDQIREEPLAFEGLKCDLRRYQEWGVKYILHQKRVLLGDEMGLGKTVQAIAAMVSLANEGCTHFLCVVPASVLVNWCREITKMSDLKVIRVHGKTRLNAFTEWKHSGGVAVTTYETTKHLRMLYGDRLDMMVVDEAHYIKNPQAQRTVNVKRLALYADRLLFMTGTPLENNVEEMMNLIDILQPETARALQGKEYMATAEAFRKTITPVYYRRKSEDVLTELPELIEKEQWCELSLKEREAYNTSVLARNFMAARRLSWDVDDLHKSAKAVRMAELIDEATKENRKILVFSYFLDTIAKIKDFLGDKTLEPITGAMSPEKRQEVIDAFDQAQSGKVLIAQITAGGTGLNIQAASVVILCEPQLKPSTEVQAIARAYRMGQVRSVLVYRLLSPNTIDERIRERLMNKQEIFETFADHSQAAQEDLAIDDATMAVMIDEEIARIQTERKLMGPDGDDLAMGPDEEKPA